MKMKKTNKYLTTVALCSTIMIGGLQIPAVSYAATNQPVVASQGDAALLQGFQQEIKKHVDDRKESITVTYRTKNSNIREVMNTLIGEYNKVVDSDEYLKYNVASTRYSIRGLPGNYAFTLDIKYRESKQQTEYVKTQAKAIINSIITTGMDEHEKVKAIHDYVVKHVSYDTSYQAYTAYEALANRSAVCQGYALLTYQLLEEAGIESQIVTGTGNGQPHAWNLVNIEGKWYHLDTTFDDPIPDKQGRVTYSYFNMSDEQLGKDHQWDRSKYPAATTNYYTELTNNIKASSPKALTYEQMLKDTGLVYLSEQYGANSYTELKTKLQQQFASKPTKVEIRYKQSMDGTMQDINKVLNEISWPKGAKRVSYQVAPYNAQVGYSLATITFTY
jgi:Transglutaminase-like superfamily